MSDQEENEYESAVKAMEECSSLAQLVVPMTDVLARLGLVGDLRAEEFFAYLSGLADEADETHSHSRVCIAHLPGGGEVKRLGGGQVSPGPYIRWFVEEGAPLIRQELRPDCCLNATRVCLEVMRSFNVRAFPLSVKSMVMNKRWMEKWSALGRMPTEDEMKAWVDEGGWALGIDTSETSTDATKNVWAGHLVAVVQDWLVDASAGQMSRPHKGIEVPQVFVGLTTRLFLKGKMSLIYASEDGSQLSYFARLEDESWKEMSGFQAHEHNRGLAREIVERISMKMRGGSR